MWTFGISKLSPTFSSFGFPCNLIVTRQQLKSSLSAFCLSWIFCPERHNWNSEGDNQLIWRRNQSWWVLLKKVKPAPDNLLHRLKQTQVSNVLLFACCFLVGEVPDSFQITRKSAAFSRVSPSARWAGIRSGTFERKRSQQHSHFWL